MKNLIIIILIFVSTCSIAQNQDNEINIKSIVGEQVENAKIKMAKFEQEKESYKNKVPVENNYRFQRVVKSETSSGVLNKFLILSIAGALAFSFVFFRRGTMKTRSKSVNELKSNIKMMRAERPYVKYDKILTKRRKKLQTLVFPKNIDNRTAIKVARKMKIASGEVILAATINTKVNPNKNNSFWRIKW